MTTVSGREMYLASLRRRGGDGGGSGGGGSRRNRATATPFLKSLLDDINTDPYERAMRRATASSASSSASASASATRRHTMGASSASSLASAARAYTRPRTRRKASRTREDDLAVSEASDQIYDLKKEVRAWKTENSVLKAEVNALKVKLFKKERALNAVLEEAAQDPSGTTTRPKATHMHFISKLKSKVADAEHEAQQLREQMDAMHAKLKYTRIEELELEVTTYYNEALRLRALLNEQQQQSGSSTTDTSNAATGYLPPSVAELKALKDKCSFLETENQELRHEMEGLKEEKEGLLRELGPSVGEDGEATREDEFDAMSRKQLLQEARAMAKDLKALQKKHRAQGTKLEDARAAEEEAAAEAKRLRRKLDAAEREAAALEDKTRLLEQNNTTLLQQLREGPAALRDNIQPLLEEHTSSLASRLSKLDNLEPLLETHSSTLAAKLKELEEQAKAAREAQEKRAQALVVPSEPPREREDGDSTGRKESSGKRDKKKGGVKGKTDEAVDADGVRRDFAAKRLQRHWRKHRKQTAIKKAEKDEKIAKLQAVLRAHAARKRLLAALQERHWQERRRQEEAEGEEEEEEEEEEDGESDEEEEEEEGSEVDEEESDGPGGRSGTTVSRQQQRRRRRRNQQQQDEDEDEDDDDEEEDEEEEEEEDEEERDGDDEETGRRRGRQRPNRPPTRDKPARPRHRFGARQRASQQQDGGDSARRGSGRSSTTTTTSSSSSVKRRQGKSQDEQVERSPSSRAPRTGRRPKDRGSDTGVFNSARKSSAAALSPRRARNSSGGSRGSRGSRGSSSSRTDRGELASEMGVGDNDDEDEEEETTDDELSASHPGLKLPIEDELF